MFQHEEATDNVADNDGDVVIRELSLNVNNEEVIMEANDEENREDVADLPVDNNLQQDEGANSLMETNDGQQDDEENDEKIIICLICKGKFTKYQEALTKLHRDQCQRVASEANIEKTLADHRQCFFCKMIVQNNVLKLLVRFSQNIHWKNKSKCLPNFWGFLSLFEIYKMIRIW